MVQYVVGDGYKFVFLIGCVVGKVRGLNRGALDKTKRTNIDWAYPFFASNDKSCKPK